MHNILYIKVMLVGLSVAIMQVTVSAANMRVIIFIVIMQVGVSLAFMQVVFSAVHYVHDRMQVQVRSMQVTVSSIN